MLHMLTDKCIKAFLGVPHRMQDLPSVSLSLYNHVFNCRHYITSPGISSMEACHRQGLLCAGRILMQMCLLRCLQHPCGRFLCKLCCTHRQPHHQDFISGMRRGAHLSNAGQGLNGVQVHRVALAVQGERQAYILLPPSLCHSLIDHLQL